MSLHRIKIAAFNGPYYCSVCRIDRVKRETLWLTDVVSVWQIRKRFSVSAWIGDCRIRSTSARLVFATIQWHRWHTITQVPITTVVTWPLFTSQLYWGAFGLHPFVLLSFRVFVSCLQPKGQKQKIWWKVGHVIVNGWSKKSKVKISRPRNR